MHAQQQLHTKDDVEIALVANTTAKNMTVANVMPACEYLNLQK